MSRGSEPIPSSPSEARAKTLGGPFALPIVPARMVNEALYCERLMVLEWAQGEFAHNYFTADGIASHERADRGGGVLPPPGSHEVASARSVWLTSEKLGLTGKIDVVEAADGSVVPIEYKRGHAPDIVEGAFLPERAQLAAQVMLLREHGYVCDRAEIFFAKSNKRVAITIDDELIACVAATILRVRELAARGDLPPPLQDSPKCDGCSLAGICLPDEVNFLNAPDAVAQPKIRQLLPARDDRLPLYVTEPGARVGVDGEELVIAMKESKARVRIPNTSHVTLVGNVQISTQALRRLFDRDIDVSFLSSGGWLLGRATGGSSKNADLRIAQHRAASDVSSCLKLAKAFVEAKIRNSRTMLRRNHDAPPPVALHELSGLAIKAQAVESVESLLGIEGTAARTYFGAFSGMLTANARLDFDLEGRNRRPPRDPVNALLSFAYSLLTRDLTTALADAGLDPLIGYYHRPRFGRPALALDVMEEFRPILADSVVVTALNTGVITLRDFIVHPVGVSLTQAGRRAFSLAYERRMDQDVTHPVFGYRVSWRRILEVQARLLGRYLLGEISEYPQMRPR